MEEAFDLSDLHPNWVGLATVDFDRLRFVKETCDDDAPPDNEQPPPNVARDLNGEQAKDFYVEVISTTPSVGRNKQTKNTAKTKERTPPRKTTTTTTTKTHERASPRTRRAFLAHAQQNDVAELKKTLREHPDVLNSTDEFGWSALMCAVQARSVEAARCLLEHGASPHVRDKRGRTALSLALSNGFPLYLLEPPRPPRDPSPHESSSSHCDICNSLVPPTDRRSHATSTLHALSSSARCKRHTHYGLPESNRGYQILLRAGWDRERGLGRLGDGRKFPLKAVQKRDRDGIGFQRQPKRETQPVVYTNKKLRQRSVDRDRCKEIKLRKELWGD